MIVLLPSEALPLLKEMYCDRGWGKSLKNIKPYIKPNSELVRTPEGNKQCYPNRVTEGEDNKGNIDKGVGSFEDIDRDRAAAWSCIYVGLSKGVTVTNPRSVAVSRGPPEGSGACS